MSNVISIKNGQTVDTTATYRRIEHYEVVDLFSKALTNNGLEFKVEHSSLGEKTTKRGFKFTITNMKASIHGDKGNPIIVVKNSTNKECSLNFRGGFYRFACSNQMVVGKDVFIGKLVHRVGETFEEKLKQLEYQIAAFADQMSEMALKVEKATSAEQTPEQMVSLVEKLNLPKKITEDAKVIILGERKREEDKKNNLWTLWNIVNESIKTKCKTESAIDNHNDRLFDKLLLAAA